MHINYDPRDFDALYELRKQEYRDRLDVKYRDQENEEDLQELAQLQEYEIYNS